jgi:hypothetical protein
MTPNLTWGATEERLTSSRADSPRRRTRRERWGSGAQIFEDERPGLLGIATGLGWAGCGCCGGGTEAPPRATMGLAGRLVRLGVALVEGKSEEARCIGGLQSEPIFLGVVQRA